MLRHRPMLMEMGPRRRLPAIGLLTVVLAVPPVVGAIVELSPRSAGADETRPSVVLILTDDQRADTLQYMPIVRDTLGDHGVTFTNAYVVNPLCCPSRSTIMTGLYSHSTGVYSNNPNGFAGGFPAFDDGSTIATWLHDSGYRTGLFGKYLNGYTSEYVPPGWDRWFVTHKRAAYYQYRATSDGTVVSYGHDPGDYGTTVLEGEAVSFIRETPSDVPLFAYISVPAPHHPAIAAPGDQQRFNDLEPWRPPSYNEQFVREKPLYIRHHHRLTSERRLELDRVRLRQIRSLLAVDRLVGHVVEALKETGRLEHTIVAFTSDNGMLWGEHRWEHKDVPYEESVGVPLVVRYDALIPAAREDRNLVLNVDFAPTFAAAAGVTPPETEGMNLLPLLLDPMSPWRDGFLIEHMVSRGDGVPSYCAYHTHRYVLIRYDGHESELYDLKLDPWQQYNQVEVPAYAQVRASLDERLVAACVPLPPALTL
jgi:arylsulfatase A-like enzyme